MLYLRIKIGEIEVSSLCKTKYQGYPCQSVYTILFTGATPEDPDMLTQGAGRLNALRLVLSPPGVTLTFSFSISVYMGVRHKTKTQKKLTNGSIKILRKKKSPSRLTEICD